ANDLIQSPRGDGDSAAIAACLPGEQRMPARFPSKVKISRAALVAQSYWKEFHVCVPVQRDALFDPFTVGRLRLESEHPAAGSENAGGNERKIALVDSHVDKCLPGLKKLSHRGELLNLVVSQGACEHHRRFCNVQIDPTAGESVWDIDVQSHRAQQ